MVRTLLAVLLLCGVLGTLAGCGPKSRTGAVPAGAGGGSIVGVWESDAPNGGTMEFTADNSLKIKQPGNAAFTWYKVDGDKMTIGHLRSGAMDETVPFKVSGNKLDFGYFHAKYHRK